MKKIVYLLIIVIPTTLILYCFPNSWVWIKDNYSGLIVALTIIGWLVIIILDLFKIKYDLRLRARYEAYQKLMDRGFQLTNQTSKLASNFSEAPFFFVELHAKGYLKDEKKAREKWSEYLTDVESSKRALSNAYIELIKEFELWEPFLKNLDKPKKIFSEQFTEMIKGVTRYWNYLIKLNVEDYEDWDKKEIEKEREKVYKEIFVFVGYQIDLKRLFAKTLMSNVFKEDIGIRKVLKPEIKVLTENGLETVMESDKSVYEKNGFPVPEELKKTGWVEKIKKIFRKKI